MLLSTKELSALGLTKAQAELLLGAALRENNRVNFYGVQDRTKRHLIESGYVARMLVSTPEQIERITKQRERCVDEAKQALNAGEWQTALSLLRQAESLDKNAIQTEPRLTAKGKEFVRQYKQRQDAI